MPLSLNDISCFTGAFRAKKLPIPIEVFFAKADGVLATREGQVGFKAGDALLTGVENERWPVQREKFFQSYEPQSPTQAGDSGKYVKRSSIVWCFRVNKAEKVLLSENRGQLHAVPGDVIVQYQPGDLAVVSSSIFAASYEVCADE